MLGAAVPPEVCTEDFGAPKFPNGSLGFVAFPSCGLLRLKSDPVVPPALALLDGAGPAGVVDPNENAVLGLLAGVAFACAAGALELVLPNKPPPAVLPAIPNDPELWPVLDVSAGLFGVEKPANPEEEPAPKALLVGTGPKPGPLDINLPLPPNMFPPLEDCCAPPNGEGFWLFDPSNEFVGAVLVLLEPKGPPPGGLKVFEDVWPKPPLVAVVLKENVGSDFGGSDIVIVVWSKG